MKHLILLSLLASTAATAAHASDGGFLHDHLAQAIANSIANQTDAQLAAVDRQVAAVDRQVAAVDLQKTLELVERFITEDMIAREAMENPRPARRRDSLELPRSAPRAPMDVYGRDDAPAARMYAPYHRREDDMQLALPEVRGRDLDSFAEDLRGREAALLDSLERREAAFMGRVEREQDRLLHRIETGEAAMHAKLVRLEQELAEMRQREAARSHKRGRHNRSHRNGTN